MNIEQEREAFEVWLASQSIDQREDICPWSAYQGWQARAALQSQDREDAQEIASTLATVLHFIPKQEEPELYADIERLCGEFIDHARRAEGEANG